MDTLNNGDLLIVQKQVPTASYKKSIFMSFKENNLIQIHTQTLSIYSETILPWFIS